MSDTYAFAGVVLLIALVGLLALLANRLTERIRVPAPLLMLVASAAVVQLIPSLHAPPEHAVEELVTVALACVLFDGGLHIGWGRLRAAAWPVASVGVLGTFLTAAGGAAVLHVGFGLDWYLAFLVATAVAPTDPAVVFSVLGKREVEGRSGTILEGESGANDPVGIALMASLLSAGRLDGGAIGHVAGEFALQMGVGAAIGLIGGRALLWFMRTVPLPSEGLYPLRTLAGALALYGAGTLAHGSGFLAVFVAGILIGDERAPYKREVERFHGALASLGEIVAFVVLGMTVDLAELTHRDVWLPGLVLGVLLAAVIRPVAGWLCLRPARLARNEEAFVLFAGLKGAVPILLGVAILAKEVAHAERLFGIVVVVVVLSVLVQGSLVPAVAGWLRLPMREIEPEPWALGVRLRSEPTGAHLFTVGAGAPAAGARVADLPAGAWVSLLLRADEVLPVRSETVLQAGDEVLVLAGPEHADELATTFGSLE